MSAPLGGVRVPFNGTYYDDRTPSVVVAMLEAARISRPRLRIVVEYGDAATGRAWGDSESGYVSRSTGTTPIPILVHNARSMGGGGLLDHCIVRMRYARGGRVLYAHPNYPKGPPLVEVAADAIGVRTGKDTEL